MWGQPLSPPFAGLGFVDVHFVILGTDSLDYFQQIIQIHAHLGIGPLVALILPVFAEQSSFAEVVHHAGSYGNSHILCQPQFHPVFLLHTVAFHIVVLIGVDADSLMGQQIRAAVTQNVGHIAAHHILTDGYCFPVNESVQRPEIDGVQHFLDGFVIVAIKEAYEKLDAENRQNHSSSFTDRYHRILNLHCTGRMNGVVSVEFLRSQQGTFFDIQPNANEKADATVTADFDYFLGMAQGTVSFDKLFLGGQLTVEGNLAKGVQIRQPLTRPPRTE